MADWMRSRLLKAVSAIAVIALASAACWYALGGPAQPDPKAKETEGDGPYLSRLNRSLDSLMAEARDEPQNGRSLVFSGTHVFSYGQAIKRYPQKVHNQYADALREAGAGRAEIYPSASTWAGDDREAMDRYAALVRHMKAVGLEVAISPEFYRGEREIREFSDWEGYALPAYREMARRLRPDIFVVIHEPTTMAERMGIRTTPGQWREFVKKAAQAVREASPDTRVAAGGQHYELPFIRQWLDFPELEVVTINIYGLGHMETYDRIIGEARASGKSVYIEETWRFPPQGPGGRTLEQAVSSGIGLERYEEIDGKWLEAMALYAASRGLEAITPFWTTTFFKRVEEGGSGLDSSYNDQVAKAIVEGRRTDTFRTYKRLSGRYGAAPGKTR